VDALAVSNHLSVHPEANVVVSGLSSFSKPAKHWQSRTKTYRELRGFLSSGSGGTFLAWRPLQPNHAIERVRIVVRFQGELTSKFIRKLAADGEELRVTLGFTSKNLREGHKIDVSPAGVSLGNRGAELLGWDWQKLSPANSPLETFLVEKQHLVYETAEYTRWGNFISRFEEVALPTLEALIAVVDVAAVSLEYVDRFFFDGAPTEASPSGVLTGFLGVLPDNAENGQDLWHLHRGWFEAIAGEQLLINQNFDAQDGALISGEPVRSLQMLTKTELRPASSEFDYSTLRPHLDSMHDRSNALFRNVLTEEMQGRVGLTGGLDAGKK